VLYAEWAGAEGQDLATEALAYGRATGTILLGAPSPLPVGGARRFMNDLAVGGSYTTRSEIVLNLEFHYHQAGFGGGDWDRWFAAGTAPARAPLLWYIRGYASEQQQPAGRRSVFLRADRTDAFIRNLELTAFALVDLHDGSALAQASADYFVSDRLTVGAIVTGDLGGRRTNFGSLATGSSLLVKVARYF
jgi:hypothetical protein